MGHRMMMTPWHGARAIDRMARDVERAFWGCGPGYGGTTRMARSATPVWQWDRSDDGWSVTVELPGYEQDEVAVDLDGRQLSVVAEHRAEVEVPSEDEDDETTRVEEQVTERRSLKLRLPEGIDEAEVSASLKAGLLRIALPKATPVDTSRRIDLND